MLSLILRSGGITLFGAEDDVSQDSFANHDETNVEDGRLQKLHPVHFVILSICSVMLTLCRPV